MVIVVVYLEGNYKAILRFLVFLYLRLNVGILEFPDYKHYLFDDSDTDGVNVGVLTPPLDIVKEIFEQNGYIMRNLPINDSRSFPPKEQLCFMASRLCYAFWNIYTGVGALNHYEYHSSTFSERLRPVRYVDFWGKAEKTTCVMPWGFNMYMPVGPHFCYLVESGRRANPIIIKCKCNENSCNIEYCDCLAAEVNCTHFCENKGANNSQKERKAASVDRFWYSRDSTSTDSREILTARAWKNRRLHSIVTHKLQQIESTEDSHQLIEEALYAVYENEKDPFTDMEENVLLEPVILPDEVSAERMTLEEIMEERQENIDNLGEEDRFFCTTQLTEKMEQSNIAEEKERDLELEFDPDKPINIDYFSDNEDDEWE
jgi:hypothetical protein